MKRTLTSKSPMLRLRIYVYPYFAMGLIDVPSEHFRGDSGWTNPRISIRSCSHYARGKGMCTSTMWPPLALTAASSTLARATYRFLPLTMEGLCTANEARAWKAVSFFFCETFLPQNESNIQKRYLVLWSTATRKSRFKSYVQHMKKHTRPNSPGNNSLHLPLLVNSTPQNSPQNSRFLSQRLQETTHVLFIDTQSIRSRVDC